MELDTVNEVVIKNDIIKWPVGKYFRRQSPQSLRSLEFFCRQAYWYFSLSTQIFDNKINYSFELHKDRMAGSWEHMFCVRLHFQISKNKLGLFTSGWTGDRRAKFAVICFPSEQRDFYDAVLSCSIDVLKTLSLPDQLDMSHGFLAVIGCGVSGLKTQEKKEVGSQSIPKLIEDLKNLLVSKENSDVVLKISDKEFQAHRLILEARSPVFSAMFKHDTAEKQSGIVDIEGCDVNTFPEFLHYVYTGTVENLSSENVHHLYAAADRYEVMELKKDCLNYMKKYISVESFCDVLSLALLYGETELVNIATEFFLNKAEDIVVTAKWLRYLTENCAAGNELIVKLAKRRSTK